MASTSTSDSTVTIQSTLQIPIQRPPVIPASVLVHSFAGFVSGLFATVLTYPLDFVKVRYIAQDGQKSRALDGVTRFRGTLHAIRASYSVAGLAPMYQGIGAAMCASSASWAIYFGVFRYLQMAYRECFSGGMGGNAKGSSAGPLGDSLSASSAGVVATLTTCPLWLVKTRMQLQRGAGEGVLRYRSTCHGLKHILKNEGVVGLYSGLTPSLMMVSHGTVQITLYEFCKTQLGRRRGLWGCEEGARLNTAEIAAATLGSKCVASMFTTPLVVLRIRLQDPRNVAGHEYQGVLRSLQYIVKHEGVRGLYRGLVPTLVRTLPGAIITFLSYEHISNALFDVSGIAKA